MANIRVYNGEAICQIELSALGLGVVASSGAEGCGFDPRLAHQRRNEAKAELEPTIRTGKRKAESWETESLRGKTVRP
jgi:hypothetical protein